MDYYIQPKLPYDFDALEPYIDAKTMHVHYEGHHRTYVENLNATLEDYPKLRKHVEELLASVHVLPIEIQAEVAENAGGHANHSLFWTLLTPKQVEKTPCGEFSHALEGTF